MTESDKEPFKKHDCSSPELAKKIEKLPKWAQRYIQQLELEIGRRDGLVTAHSLLCDEKREWFTITGPKREENMKLWLLKHDKPLPVCSIGPEDVILVARANPMFPAPIKQEDQK